MEMVDITPIINALILLAAAIITVLVAKIKSAAQTQERKDAIDRWIDIAVQSAEQLYKNGRIEDRLTHAKAVLEDKGYYVDEAEIEAAVQRLNARNGGDKNGL